MIDYQIQPSTRRCCVSGRELRPGERFYSVLLEEDGKFLRKDYSAEAWQGPPDDAFSFWMGRLNPPHGPRRPPIDDDMLMDCFQRLEGQWEPSRLRFRFVLALLLMRRRRLKFEQTQQDGPQELLVLRCTRDGGRHRVVNPNLTDEELETVQDEVFQALGWE